MKETLGKITGKMRTLDKVWGTGCLIYGVAVVVLFLGAAALVAVLGEKAEEDFMTYLCPSLLLWLAGPLPGVVILAEKGYWRILISVGILGLLLLCLVWPLPFMLWVVTGPALWLIAMLLPARKRCPYCRKVILASATRCPHCTTDLTD